MVEGSLVEMVDGNSLHNLDANLDSNLSYTLLCISFVCLHYQCMSNATLCESFLKSQVNLFIFSKKIKNF